MNDALITRQEILIQIFGEDKPKGSQEYGTFANLCNKNKIPFEIEVSQEMNADAFIILSHAKGHSHCTGFGGATKNIGMGCVSGNTKLWLHMSGGPKLTGVCNKCKKFMYPGITAKVSTSKGYIRKQCLQCEKVAKLKLKKA